MQTDFDPKIPREKFSLLKVYIMKEFKLPVQVSLTNIRGKEISTVKLNSMGRKHRRYETCVFLPNGDSEVVGLYSNAKSAHFGHMRIVSSFI